MAKMFFICRTCRLNNGFEVPDRRPDDADVIAYMNVCGGIAGYFHGYLSPKCLSRTLDFAIPTDKDAPIGSPVANTPTEVPDFLKAAPSGADDDFPTDEGNE